jgi:acyl-CoA synthetase (AMP-forming)/AMP-acid ligase II
MALHTPTVPGGDHLGVRRIERNLIHRVNVGDMIVRSAARAPGGLALVDGDRRITYGELGAAVNRIAHGLAARGYASGDALALVSGNSAEFLQTYYACALLGVVCVPINLGWRAAEVAYVLRHARVRGVVVEAQLREWLAPALAEVPEVGDVFVAPGTGTGTGTTPDGHGDRDGDGAAGPFTVTWAELEAGAPDTVPECEVADRDPITYLYTSGTTAAPKGVVGSHLGIYLESTSAIIDLGLTRTDRVGALLPLFHTAQLNCFATPVALAGATLHLMRGFDAAGLMEQIETERLTVIFALPMMYRALLEHPGRARRDLSSLRLAVYAMAPMPDADLRACLTAFGCDFALLFGQTEMAPITTVFRPEHQLTHTGSVGTPTVNIQTAIMADDGTLLPAGHSGEIVYRGPHALEGYLRDDAATDRAFAHGWFHSGDVGHFDGDGILWFEDRKKDVIKTGGENVASIEVEKALYADPRIGEVVVVGLPHPRWHEAITAVAVPAPGATLDEADVLAGAKQRLAPYKVPKALVVLDELPRTTTGKVQKNLLRERLADLYGTPD